MAYAKFRGEVTMTLTTRQSTSKLVLATVLLLLYPAHANVQETLIGIAGKDFVILGADSSISSQGSIAWTAQVDKIAVMGSIAAAAAGDVADSDRLIGLLRAHCAIREFETSVGSDVEYVVGTEGDEVLVEPTHYGLTVDEMAHLARHQIAASLRSRGRLNVCLLIAGITIADSSGDGLADNFASRVQNQVRLATAMNRPSESLLTSTKAEVRPRLFWLDQYGSLQALRYGVHGFAANFLLSVLDQGYREDMSKDEAIELMKLCFEQLRVRYIIHSPNAPNIKCIDQDGCRVIN
jgi:20S proteasome alpha/beta subunit